MERASSDDCITCNRPVRARQEGIQCDGCGNWNHRTCDTGISQQEYRAAVRADADIAWFCPLCPVAESSRLDEFNPPVSSTPPSAPASPAESFAESSTDILESDEFNPPVGSTLPSASTESFSQSTVYDPPACPAIEECNIEPMNSEPMEDSIADPIIQDMPTESYSVTYQLVEGGTQRARKKLIDSDGYCYNVKQRRKNATYWQCTVRPTGNQCKAIVVQRGSEFSPGNQSHNHQPSVGAATAAKIMAAVKEKATADVFKPASEESDGPTIPA